MPRDLIPELHDVLKLTVLKHNFSDFGPFQSYAPVTASWRGVLEHHCDEFFPAYPTNRDTFLLHMADGMAANFSRHPQQIRHDTAWMIYRLWKPQPAETDRRLREQEAIIRMLHDLGKDPTFEDFYKSYEDIFRGRSEDAHPGMNVTSLETHVRLVGRLYRFLQKSSSLNVSEEEVQDAVSRGKLAVRSRIGVLNPGQQTDIARLQPIMELRERKKREWHIYLLRCRLSPLAYPFRARDLNVFSLIDEFLKDVRTRFSDNLLFASSEEIVLYADELAILTDLEELAFPRGIWLDVEKKRERLDMLTPEFKNRADVALYPVLDAEIAPPLCELCQMKSATREWPRDYIKAAGSTDETAEGTDRLCETCFSIRSRPSRLRKLAQSSDWADGNVIWARFSIDFSGLYGVLRRIYLAYLRSLDPSTPDSKSQVRFSLIAEFQGDYSRFLDDLERRLLAQFREQRAETLLRGLYCLKSMAGSDVFTALQIFRATVAEFFPVFLQDTGSPLRVSLTLCPVRYPFFEVWRTWQDQKAEIAVVAEGHGQIELDLHRLHKFLELTQFQFRRSVLHDLAEISKISEQLAELRFHSRSEKGERQTFDHLSAFLPLGIGFEGVLTLAKLLGN